MVQRFGSWTAYGVAHSLIGYWIWGEPIRSILEAIVPPGASPLTRSLLDAACPILSTLDRILTAISFVIVPLASFLVGLIPQLAAFDIAICLRKRFFFDRAVNAIESDGRVRQVLVLGGGYDVLMLNLARRYPQIVGVEVDHPFTSTAKRAAVTQLGLRTPNAHFLALDLAVDRLEDQLSAACPDWDRTRPSVVVAEGLFMYLRPDQVRQALRSIRAVTGPGSILIFSYAPRALLVRPMLALVRLLGEPIQWAPADNDEVAALIGGEGFQVDLSPAQSDNYGQYLAKDGRLPSSRWYTNQNGVAITQ